MERTTHFIKDFSASVLQKDCLTRERLMPGKWQLVEYETVENSGVMLYSDNAIMPPTVTAALDLTGWYRIHVCIFSGETYRCGLSLRLSGDSSPSFFTQGPVSKVWSAFERGEEFFWKAADLTGRTIDIGKLPGTRATKVGLLWLRFEPMNDQEVRDYQAEFSKRDTRRLHAHTDGDWLEFLGKDATLDEYASVMDEWARSDIDIASVELAYLVCDYGWAEKLCKDGREEFVSLRVQRSIEFKRRLPEVVGEYARRAEKHGIKLYCAQRMGLANFVFPMGNNQVDHMPFVTENPQWFCHDRNGDVVATLSYAYPDVGDYMIGKFLEAVELGCHGATLIWIRGVQVLFEEPVRRRFAELYPGVDPCTLPLTDERLSNVRCSFITDFMRRLRKAFDDCSEAKKLPHLGINAIVCYGFDDNRIYGLDVETWAREGLVDSLVVGNMKLWEEDKNFRDDDHPELISVDKFDAYKKHGPMTPIQRIHGSDISPKLPHIHEYMELARETGIKVFFEMPWEGRYEPQELRNYALELYRNGVENIALWDCYTLRVMHRPEWLISSRLGHKDELPSMPAVYDGYRRAVRVTSMGGVSIASYNPSWRG
ncbi:MAG: hypothetical protein J6X55_07355 [Victivallales bacterium]|nr:hypothetical protein [Victivallales bacterium]